MSRRPPTQTLPPAEFTETHIREYVLRLAQSDFDAMMKSFLETRYKIDFDSMPHWSFKWTFEFEQVEFSPDVGQLNGVRIALLHDVLRNPTLSVTRKETDDGAEE